MTIRLDGPKKSETTVNGWLLVLNADRFRFGPRERDFRDIVRYGSLTPPPLPPTMMNGDRAQQSLICQL